MSNIAIKTEDVGKLYRLGQIGTGTISHDLNRWFARIRGKEDPFAKVGEVNDRTAKGDSDYVWALKDVNFEVEKGSAVGIIGRNGAGKSTLLKLLSKVTKPTTGKIYIQDRIASLLEVGTGFHPEMTGRENIYLNGAILGMTKREITRKFDEIVAFAGVERYIDTPVKRYSSGMYVRLAFAVAAHLESEILIVDEVLAVGDAEFQKKCLGKMGEVSQGEGRTVLFVSHNMGAIKSLCNATLFMQHGQVKTFGETATVINEYLRNFATKSKVLLDNTNKENSNEYFEVEYIKLITDSDVDGSFYIDRPISIELSIINKSVTEDINFNLFFDTTEGIPIFATSSLSQPIKPGRFTALCEIPAHFLNDDIYSISIMGVASQSSVLIHIKNALTIEGVEPPRKEGWMGKFPGLVRPKFNWQIIK